MTDKKIITQKEKNYIETLYLYFNIENASDTLEHATIRYHNVIDYMTDNMFANAEYLAFSNNRSFSCF